jgi:hypothetical protein
MGEKEASMSDKISKNLERFRRAVATHDVENPKHTSYGIGVSQFDLERLGFEEDEELWEGIRIKVDGKTSGNFRVLCDGDHDECNMKDKEAVEKEPVHAVAKDPDLVEA